MGIIREDDVVELTHKTYDKIAPEYSRKTDELVFHSWIRKFVEEILNKFLSLIKFPKPRILEIGCGNGRTVEYLQQKGAVIIGTDISLGMLKEAKKNVPDGDFRQMDMRYLEFLDSTFNGIWADGCIYHVPKKDFVRVLKEAFRVLESAGILSFNFKIGTDEQVDENPRSYGENPRFYAYYTIEEMRQLVKENGFEIIEMQPYPDKILDESIVQVWAKKA